MDRSKNYSLLLLAGGKSSRMGRNKAELYYKGKTFVESLLSKGQELGITRVYLSGYSEVNESVQVVWDIYPDRGPLGGIHAGMKVMDTEFCLILPVDVPQIPVTVLEELIKYHENDVTSEKDIPLILQHGDRKEYLIGVYPVNMLSFIEEQIVDHPASVHRMLEEWGYSCYHINVPEWQVENINTEDAYESLLLCHF